MADIGRRFIHGFSGLLLVAVLGIAGEAVVPSPADASAAVAGLAEPGAQSAQSQQSGRSARSEEAGATPAPGSEVTHGGRRFLPASGATGGTARAALTSVRAAAATPPVGSAPPDPGRNIDPGPALPDDCYLAPAAPSCVSATVAALNRARGLWGQRAYSLPADFGDLPPATQLLLLANDDRAVYGLPPVVALNSTLDNAARAGAAADDDPAAPDQVSGVPALRWSSNWAGGYPTVVAAYYAWMWDDGLGSDNLDCTPTHQSGCWGHRRNVLLNFGTDRLYAGVGMVTTDVTYQYSFAMILWAAAGSGTVPTRPALLGISPSAGTAVPAGTRVTLTGLGLGSVGTVSVGGRSVAVSSRASDGRSLTFTAPAVTGAAAVLAVGSGGTADLARPVRLANLAPVRGGSYVAVNPARVLDTRTGFGAARAGPIPANGTITLQIGGRGGIPSSATAVLLNVTAVTPGAIGDVALYPTGAARPYSSNLNLQVGVTTANAVLVGLGSGGRVQITTSTKQPLSVVADALGYVAGGSSTGMAGAIVPVTPARLLDTRSGFGATRAAPVAAHGTIRVKVAGRGGVPASGVAAAMVTITAVVPPVMGNATAWSGTGPAPGTSVLNYRPGVTTPGFATVPVAADGTIAILNNSAAAVQLVVDVAGWVRSGSPVTAGAMVPVTPSRLLDSRTGVGLGAYPPWTLRPPAGTPGWQLTTDQDWMLQVTGRGGVPAVGVSAVVLTITTVYPTGSGFVTAHGTGTPRPGTSLINFIPGAVVPNTVVVPVGAGGLVTLHLAGTSATGLLADVSGYVLNP
jgi:hypothetical protein